MQVSMYFLSAPILHATAAPAEEARNRPSEREIGRWRHSIIYSPSFFDVSIIPHMRFSIFGFEAPQPNPPILHRNKIIETGRDYAKRTFWRLTRLAGRRKGKRLVSGSQPRHSQRLSLESWVAAFSSGCLMFAATQRLIIIRWRFHLQWQKAGRVLCHRCPPVDLVKTCLQGLGWRGEDGDGPHQTPLNSFELIKSSPLGVAERCFALMELLANLLDF